MSALLDAFALFGRDKNIIIILITAFLVSSLDFLTKMLVVDFGSKGKFFVVSKNIFLERVFNTGISFGLFSDHKVLSYLVPAVTLGIVVFLVAEYYDYLTTSLSVFVGMIFGGGLSNYLERLIYGRVTDFISISSLWPFFNVADSFVTIGTVLLFVDILLNLRKNTFKNRSKRDSKTKLKSDLKSN